MKEQENLEYRSWDWDKFKKDFTRDFIAGSISGAAVQTALHKLDTSIVRDQAGTTAEAAKGSTKGIKTIGKKIGKGVLAAGIGYPTYQAAASYIDYKSKLKALKAKHAADPTEPMVLRETDELTKTALWATVAKLAPRGLKALGSGLKALTGLGPQPTFKAALKNPLNHKSFITGTAGSFFIPKGPKINKTLEQTTKNITPRLTH